MAAGLYDILNNETLGKGHFAVVKLGRHVLTGELVAVKIVDKLRLKKENFKPLSQEIRLLTRLSEKEHPNIVKLYQVIDTKYKLYFIMEYSGRDVCDLYDFIQKNNSGNGLREPIARHIFRQICMAIDYCHSLRIVHRDLKPENILIVSKPEDEEHSVATIEYPVVKIVDFGLSSEWNEGEKLRTSCGSLAYSPPEILIGELYDGDKVDVWGLGCILYILLYGNNPFMQLNDSETLIRILDCSYNTPARPNISDTAISLIRALLRKDPKSRLTVRQILAHEWLVQSEQQKKIAVSELDSVLKRLQQEPSVTDEEREELNNEVIDLKRRINANIAVTDSPSETPKLFTRKREEITRSQLHEKVIEQMITQSMCTSRQQVEYALQRSREFAQHQAPAQLLRNGCEQSSTQQPSRRTDETVPAGEIDGSGQCDSILANVSDNKLINEQLINEQKQYQKADSDDSTRPFNQDAYITATYHLLKDKLYREHHGISQSNHPTIGRTMHHKKMLPNRPRKSMMKAPQFGSPSLRSTSGSNEDMQLNDIDEKEEVEIKSLELPFEEESAFTLPLARKCSIVSEEGSCVGGDFSGTECGSDSVLDYASLSNFHSLTSVGEQQEELLETSKSLPKFPIVDIIITDYSSYDDENGDKSTAENMDTVDAPIPLVASYGETAENDQQQQLQRHENAQPPDEESATNTNNQSDDAFYDQMSYDAVDNCKSDDTSTFTKQLSKIAEQPQICTLMCSTIKTNPLHLVSSSPDLLRSAEGDECSNGKPGDMLLNQKEETYSDAIGEHLRMSHQLSQYRDNTAYGLIAGSTGVGGGSSVGSTKMHTSMRVITASKSCNNILIGDNENGSNDCTGTEGRRKKRSTRRLKKKASAAVSADGLCDEDAGSDDSAKKHRKDKIECCLLL